MAILDKPLRRQKVYYHTSTKNTSFIKMYKILEMKGISKNLFFLALYDPALKDVDPYDPNLSLELKTRIMAECTKNIWYFLREVVRIPTQGDEVGSGVRYQLHRGNLALTWCMVNNINFYVELARQNFKSISIAVNMLWIYQFGTTNSEIMFMNKTHGDSKLNLQRLKEIRDVLPQFLQFKHTISDQGKILKNQENVESITHPKTNNKVVTKAKATSQENADKLGRGCTQPVQWYDEFAFISHILTIYNSATPAQSQASLNASRNGKPAFIAISSTPGDILTQHGADSRKFLDNCAQFREEWYDEPVHRVHEIIDNTSVNKFAHIKFSYLQLGRTEEWFAKQVDSLQRDWAIIRREFLLEWAMTSGNSPFEPEDLEEISTLSREPLRSVNINKLFYVDIYSNKKLIAPPIMGVDVSGGYRKDASTFVIIDSDTTEVIADFGNNKIGIRPFSRLITQTVKLLYPRAVVVVERNSYGEGVISNLKSTSIKKNLYYEFKEKQVTERLRNGQVVRNRTIKEYGVWNKAQTRDAMMDILRHRVEYHKKKFVSPTIIRELQGLEMKKGRIDHGSQTHDDRIFGLLMALYVYIYGTNLRHFQVFPKENLETDGAVVDEFAEDEILEGWTPANVIADDLKDVNDPDDEFENVMKMVKASSDMFQNPQTLYEKHLNDMEAEEESQQLFLRRHTSSFDTEQREALGIDVDSDEEYIHDRVVKVPASMFRDLNNWDDPGDYSDY